MSLYRCEQCPAIRPAPLSNTAMITLERDFSFGDSSLSVFFAFGFTAFDTPCEKSEGYSLDFSVLATYGVLINGLRSSGFYISLFFFELCYNVFCPDDEPEVILLYSMKTLQAHQCIFLLDVI